MEWVRKVRRKFVDCSDHFEKEGIDKLKAIFRGEIDVSEFDNEREFILAVQMPPDIECCDGTTQRYVFFDLFKWDVADVVFLVQGLMPTHHPSISEAGFPEKDLIRLADPSQSALDYIEGLETWVGYEKGHYLEPGGKSRLRRLEQSFSAKVRIFQRRDRLSDPLRATHKAGVSISGKDRNEVLQDQYYVCIFCGRTRPDVELQAHHVIPRSFIKKLQLNECLYTCRWNLVCACLECNQAKSDTLAAADIKFLMKHIESGFLEKNLKLLPSLKALEDLQQRSGD